MSGTNDPGQLPEGHTLHRLAAELLAEFGGQKIVSTSPQGRFAADLADGRELASAQAWGKHLLIEFAALPEQAHVHLGLYGRWSITTGRDIPITGQVRWRITGEASTADLRGPARCEWLWPPEAESLLSRLGPDPLRDDADGSVAGKRIMTSGASIATLLIDQSVIAGAGNIFRAEVLFRLGIAPHTPGRRLDEAVWNMLWDDLVFLMRQAQLRGRIDTVRPEHEPEAMGREPRIDEHGGEVYVYRRDGQPCHVCQTTIAATVLQGRKLFWCSRCQPSERFME